MTHTFKRSGLRAFHAGLHLAARHAAGAVLALAACSLWAAPLDDIRRQVESSQFDQAYQTAQSNPQLHGDVHFDFLYGVAAINVGRVAEGVLALERHLAAVPANDRARLELARGYFLLGEFTRARSEFEFVLRYNPPAGVRSNISGFLQAMQTREAADRRATARFYFESGAGRDNNVNGGTFRDQVDSPLGVLSLGGSQQLPDNFGQLAVGGQQQYRVSSRMSVFAGGDLDLRFNERQRPYDLSTANLYMGFSNLSGPALWRTTLSLNELRVGNKRYRDTLQVLAEANVSLGPELSLLAFAQYGDYHHAVTDEIRDARATTLGGMLTRNFPDTAWSPTVGVRASYTQEDNQRLRKDLSNAWPLLRVFAAVTPIERVRISAGLSAFSKKYGEQDLVLQTVREDSSLSADLSMNIALDANWSLRTDAAISETRSNQDLYDTRRKALSVKLRYQY